jgi:hypothetical protein
VRHGGAADRSGVVVDSLREVNVIVPIGAIVVREVPWPRKVEQFRELLRAGQKLPPIKVMRYSTAWNGAKRWLVYDGHHRAAALRQEGANCVDAVEVTLS